MNDNYRFARRAVFEQVLELIAEDHSERDMRVTMGSGESKRVIVLNTWDQQTGAPVNQVKDAPVKVGMALTAHKTVVMFMRYVHTEDKPVREAAELVANRRKSVVSMHQEPKEVTA